MDDVKKSYTFLIVFLLLIAAVGGYLFYRYFMGSPSSTSQDSLSRGVTSTWKTYTSTAYGFEFKYPSNRTAFQSIDRSAERLVPASASSDFVAVAHRETPYIFNDTPQIVSFEVKHESIDTRNWLNAHQSDYFSSAPAYVRDGTFGGRNALEAGSDESSGTHRLFILPLGNNLLVVRQTTKSTLLDDVVKSFRFTN